MAVFVGKPITRPYIVANIASASQEINKYSLLVEGNGKCYNVMTSVGMQRLIVLFTNFGDHGPYLGQMEAVLYRCAPEQRVINLLADAPAHDIRAAAYLLAAYAVEFPPESVFLAVVDPGVGGPRRPLVIKASGRWYVGPDNGLFEIVVRRAKVPADCWEITWVPERLSPSFHGRDLFGPIAARIASGESVAENHDFKPCAVDNGFLDWPDDLAEIIYIDHFGNAITGLRAQTLPDDAEIALYGRMVPRAKTFSSVSPGEMFCYENSNGLLEIAINMGRAANQQGIELGGKVSVS